jgi:5-methylcytosine-specific restriction protein A
MAQPAVTCWLCLFHLYLYFRQRTPALCVVRRLDSAADLRPVCPNCHAMLHRDSQVMSLERLKELIKK